MLWFGFGGGSRAAETWSGFLLFLGGGERNNGQVNDEYGVGKIWEGVAFRNTVRPTTVYHVTCAVGWRITGQLLHAMSTPTNRIRVRVDQIERLLMFDYEPGTKEALFDILDGHGHMVKTGEVRGPVTKVRITDLDGEEYFLMVLDGELSTVKPFQLRKVG